MEIGFIGLGRMGSNMVRRLARGGHTAVVFDSSPETGASLAAELPNSVRSVGSIAEVANNLVAPKIGRAHV